MKNNIFYVIFSESSRHNGGLQPQCNLMTKKDIFECACFEMSKSGLSFEDMAGIEYVEDESGDFHPKRELSSEESFELAIAKLADDGRMFEVFLNKDEFLINAEIYGILVEAKNLIN